MIPNYFFYANLPPQYLENINAHFWSLCVEMQFYFSIALLVKLFGPRALFLMLPICLGVTLHRIDAGAEVDIVTWRRIDEILAGGILALAYTGALGEKIQNFLARSNAYFLILLLAASSHPFFGPLNYIRPYVAAVLVGTTLIAPPTALDRLLKTQTLAWIAAISYALYVIHGVLMETWLGSGNKLEKYLKRPLLIALTFALAHVSTKWFERPFNDFGRAFGKKFAKIG